MARKLYNVIPTMYYENVLHIIRNFENWNNKKKDNYLLLNSIERYI